MMYAIKKEQEVGDFLLQRCKNYIAAVLSGLLLALFFRKLGPYETGAEKFINDQFGSIALRGDNDNIPALTVMVAFAMLALFFPVAKDLAIIVWDGLAFALFAGVTAVFVILSLLSMDGLMTDDTTGLWAIIGSIMVVGGMLYTLAIPYIWFEAIIKRERVAMWFVGFVAFVYFFYFFIL